MMRYEDAGCTQSRRIVTPNDSIAHVYGFEVIQCMRSAYRDTARRKKMAK